MTDAAPPRAPAGRDRPRSRSGVLVCLTIFLLGGLFVSGFYIAHHYLPRQPPAAPASQPATAPRR